MLASLAWPAPAKLNLMLHIIGQREDGYHLLQTVFQFVDYFDTLDFTLTDDNRIHLEQQITGVPVEQDLTYRAAALLKKQTQSSQGVSINLIKRLPMGGGLGGGSSDAATVLVALNYLWKTGLNVDELAELGLKLGADVPVFVRGQSAWGEGVGEKLQPVELPQSWFLVVRPDVHIATATLFNDPDLTRDCTPIKIAAFAAQGGENVFLPLVLKYYPKVAEMWEKLTEFGSVRLTGTGACLFLTFDTESDARLVAQKIPQQWDNFVARGLIRSPLSERLERESNTVKCLK